MKELKELKFEELTVEQKLGLTLNFVIHQPADDIEFVYDLIKKRSVGSVWIQQGQGDEYKARIDKVRELADYPILIVTDAESGIGDFKVGKHNAIGTTGSEKHAYAFGKAVGVEARKLGYNMVCDPVVDMHDGAMRNLGVDKEEVTKLAMAIARGMRDGGVLNVAKHYPGGKLVASVDSHTTESISILTKEELLDYSLYPYIKLNEAGLLDGIMTKHCRFVNIDDKFPASLSKKVIDIIREQGFNGIVMTDALCMMGIRAKFTDKAAKAHALNAGNDIPLPYNKRNKTHYEEYLEAYKEGLISDEMLDAAVKRVLEAQHKTMLLNKDAELTKEEISTFRSINKDGIYTDIDEDTPKTISRDGKHYFVILTKQESALTDGKPDVDTFSGGWHDPERIAKKISELFPNASYKFIHEFPSQGELVRTYEDTLDCDELVFMTFSEALAYVGPEHLTRRVVNLVKSMQATNRISTLIHSGNPHTAEELPHIKRVLFSGQTTDSIEAALEVLAGEYTANGKPTYKFKLQ